MLGRVAVRAGGLAGVVALLYAGVALAASGGEHRLAVSNSDSGSLCNTNHLEFPLGRLNHIGCRCPKSGELALTSAASTI
jgi:hypothetical protein